MTNSGKFSDVMESVENKRIHNAGRIAQKNFLILCLGYFLLYSGFWALTNLQSTMNADSGIGVSSQAVINAFAMASSLLLPQLAISKFGCKNVLVYGTIACCGYVASNAYLRFETIMLASALFGIATGPFISAQSFYVNEMARRFHSSVGGKVENTMACFFGCYSFSLGISQVAGNFVSYLVLGLGKLSQNSSTQLICGVNFDLDSLMNVTNTQLDAPTEKTRLILIGIFTLMGVLAVFVLIFFLDHLKIEKKVEGFQIMGHSLVAALKHSKKFDQILLIPISVLLGLEVSFYANEFTMPISTTKTQYNKFGRNMNHNKGQNLPYMAAEESMDEELCINEGDPDPSTSKSLRYVQRKTFWNLFVFSFSYFLVYTGFWTLSNLQSTMNASQGMGDDSQAVIYICSMLSSVLLPTFTIGRFGCKAVLVAGTVICTLNLASNAYLRWDTLMTACALYGLINGPYQSAMTLYIDEMATRFQGTIKEHTEFVMALFFGLFMFFSESTQIWGNLISYYVLKNNRSDPTPGNTTFHSECGVHFKPSDNDTNANLDPPTESQRFILVGIFVLLGVASALILGFFLDPLKNDLQESKGCKSIVDRFLSAFKFLRNPHQLLLIPISVYIGMEGPFYSNEFTQVRFQ
ncbi:hypothetical protein JTE90_013431 [Oedothorax gibbosus]|uniref:Uncharacterized protein n=1 Tax=Oedothorax gibbosus TaxID=931172 RepID=A0AAV6UES4_9ARAC|nr:hypothetical protein JTE90_013431 [Oedothorax gibbosus]